MSKTVIQMAKEAGFPFSKFGLLQCDNDTDQMLEHLVELVRADEREQGQKWFDAVTAQHKQAILAEREACAKVCDDWAKTSYLSEAKSCAKIIRARGSNT